MAGKSKKRKAAGAADSAAGDVKREQVPTQSGQSWRHGVLLPSLVSACLLWAAFPPLGLGYLAWLAPLGWLLVAERKLPVGRGGYFSLWLSGCIFWLLILHGIRLAFWPLHFGWLALSLYLAIYIPLFVGVTRTLRRQWGLPLVLAAPTVWMGLELIRGYLITGYAANTLAHSQAHNSIVIQIADQLGGGGIGFVMMSVSVALFQLLRSRTEKNVASCKASLSWATVLLAATVGYGWWRLAQADRLTEQQQPLLRALLIQENTPTIFEINPERNQRAWTSYLNLTRAAAAEFGPVDLVVWPESTFTANEPWLEHELSAGLPAEVTRDKLGKEYLLELVAEYQQQFRHKAELVLSAATGAELGEAEAADAPRPHLLLGSDAIIYRSDRVERYNAAMFVGPDGSLLDRYYKMHLVMFGEYIPLGPLLQWLRDKFGLSGLDAGTEAKCFRLGGMCIAPSICFESMVPRLINWQVRTLSDAGTPPDLLINITNDSWFRGSSMLDHHLACSMLCAVENRRPLLVAANTGLSAQIDGSGRLLRHSQRLEAEALLAEPYADARWGCVQSFGYPLSGLAAAVTLLAMLASVFRGSNSVGRPVLGS